MPKGASGGAISVGQKLIQHYQGREWTKPGTNETRYYVNWKDITGRSPVTSSERETKIYFTKDGQVVVQSRAVGNVDYIKKLVDEERERIARRR